MLTLTAISASTSSRRSGPLCMRYCMRMLTIVSLNMKLLRCGPFFSPSSPCWVSSWFYLIKHRFYMKWIEPFQVNRIMKVLWTPTPQNCGQIRWLQNTFNILQTWFTDWFPIYWHRFTFWSFYRFSTKSTCSRSMKKTRKLLRCSTGDI